MTIPLVQLQVWSNQGAQGLVQNTHQSIRSVINGASWNQGISFNDYLQGSYRNTTNIRGTSDVDIVVELTSTFRYDYSALSIRDQNIVAAVISPATYSVNQFELEICNLLNRHYGYNFVSQKSKSIKIRPDIHNNRIEADVIPCQTYRYYLDVSRYVEGIHINASGTDIFNFPKQHIANGSQKNSNTNNNFKPVVRMFKNAKEYMVNNNNFSASTAPSYFIECLIYNVPNSEFSGDLQDIFCNVLNYYNNNPLTDTLLCQNGLIKMFGLASTQWNIASAEYFLECCRQLWKNW